MYSADALPETGRASASAPVTNPDKVAYLAFTSGTTGEPKCVMHSDNTLMANPRDMVRDWGVNAEAPWIWSSQMTSDLRGSRCFAAGVSNSPAFSNKPGRTISPCAAVARGRVRQSR